MTLLARLPPVLLVAVMLHTAVLPQLRLAGVAADLLLLTGIAAGLAAGPERGAVVGFLAGLLADCFLQTPFGLSALVYAVVGHAVGAFSTTVLHAALWIPLVTAAVAGAAGVVLFAVAGAVVGEGQLLTGHLVTVVVVVAVTNAVLLPVVAPVVRWATTAGLPPGLVVR